MTGNEQLVYYMGMNQDGIFLDNCMRSKPRDFFLHAPVMTLLCSWAIYDYGWTFMKMAIEGISIIKIVNIGDVTFKNQ